MSFTSDVKEELSRVEPVCSHCDRAQLAAIIRIEGTLFFSGKNRYRVEVATDTPSVARLVIRLVHEIYGLKTELTVRRSVLHQTPNYLINIPVQPKLAEALVDLGVLGEDGLELGIKPSLVNKQCCAAAYLRGAFLAGGSVTDPTKRYHLEMTTSHYKVSRETSALLVECGFSPKELSRGGNHILYFKQSDYIEDFLTAIGAQVSAMGVMEAKVEKDLRNGVNRRVNCETANLTKVVDASMGQMAAIRALEEAGELEKLPAKLRETALLRKENPEATLQELAEMLDPPITKSAINHRMRKLVELSHELEG